MDLKPFCCFKQKTEVELVGQGLGMNDFAVTARVMRVSSYCNKSL